jgi:hypothetical protein
VQLIIVKINPRHRRFGFFNWVNGFLRATVLTEHSTTTTRATLQWYDHYDHTKTTTNCIHTILLLLLLSTDKFSCIYRSARSYTNLRQWSLPPPPPCNGTRLVTISTGRLRPLYVYNIIIISSEAYIYIHTYISKHLGRVIIERGDEKGVKVYDSIRKHKFSVLYSPRVAPLMFSFLKIPLVHVGSPV